MSKPRLLIADDHEPIRYLLKLLTEADCDVVGEAKNGQEALDAVGQLRPDVLILDISMPGMSGFDVARILRAEMPELRIILTSQHAQRIYLNEAFRLGVNGYVLKQSAAIEMPLAIWEVLAGRMFRSPSIAVLPESQAAN